MGRKRSIRMALFFGALSPFSFSGHLGSSHSPFVWSSKKKTVPQVAANVPQLLRIFGQMVNGHLLLGRQSGGTVARDHTQARKKCMGRHFQRICIVFRRFCSRRRERSSFFFYFPPGRSIKWLGKETEDKSAS